MKIPRYCCVFLQLAGLAIAQPKIADVMNAASRIPAGVPGHGVAKGSVFVITGSNLGPDSREQASFPLPTTDGLGGVKVKVTAGDSTVDAIMVYASANEVAAILPSTTPTGAGNVSLTYNSQEATAPIIVVDSAFGAFTQGQSGSGPAVAQNVGADGQLTLNSLTQSAQPGQQVVLNGTGLGAIEGDETNAISAMSAGPDIQVFVGNQPATVVSKGRSGGAGLDQASFPIPVGAAALDQITLQVPDGVQGCFVSVVVRTGDLVSNFSTISVASGGGACSDANGFSSDDLQLLQNLTTLRFGYVSLSRTSAKLASIPGLGDLSSKTDSGSAVFYQYDVPKLLGGSQSFFSTSSIGSCMVSSMRLSQILGIINVTPPIPLDAGPVININGPKGAKQLQKDPQMQGIYYAELGKDSGMPSIPGLPAPTSSAYLEKGSYTADNGSGASDPGVGAFKANLNVPDPLVWGNQDAISSVTRANGVTVTWTGGDPQGFVNISGTSANKDVTGVFSCNERASVGTFTVPSVVLLALPPSAVEGSGGIGIATGFLSLSTGTQSKFTAPGLDLGWFSSSVASTKMLGYQ